MHGLSAYPVSPVPSGVDLLTSLSEFVKLVQHAAVSQTIGTHT